MKSNTEWREWGKRDPLWGVASWPGRQRGGPNPWTEEEFYAIGVSDWEDYRHHWEHYGLDRGVALDVGCGAGRLTEPMALDFRETHGVDVSADMLDLARRRVSSATFHLTDGLTLPFPDASVTAVISAWVFQHFDSTAMAAGYLSEAARVMVPGATLMIQVPLYQAPVAPRAFRRLYGLQRSLGQARADLQRRLIARGGRPPMRGLKYEIGWLRSTLAQAGFTDVEFRIFPVRSNGSDHSFVFARRR